MEVQLLEKCTLIDGVEEIRTWEINRGNGALTISISELFDHHVLECDWIDKDRKFLGVMYSNWEGSELYAIVDCNGNIVKRSLREITEYIPAFDLFLVIMCRFDMEDDAYLYFLDGEDDKVAVINRCGDYIVEPTNSRVYFDDEGNTFFVGNYTGTVGRKVSVNSNIKE